MSVSNKLAEQIILLIFIEHSSHFHRTLFRRIYSDGLFAELTGKNCNSVFIWQSRRNRHVIWTSGSITDALLWIWQISENVFNILGLGDCFHSNGMFWSKFIQVFSVFPLVKRCLSQNNRDIKNWINLLLLAKLSNWATTSVD